MKPERERNLHPISPPEPYCVVGPCMDCERPVDTRTGFADHSGQPFKAYFCADCARKYLSPAPTTETRQ